jgi:hypothetical protein
VHLTCTEPELREYDRLLANPERAKRRNSPRDPVRVRATSAPLSTRLAVTTTPAMGRADALVCR